MQITDWTSAIIDNCETLYKDKEEDIWSKLRLNDMWYRDMIIISGQMWGLIGAYYGICFDVVFLGGTPQNINVTHSRCKILGRFAICMLVWFIPIYLATKIARALFTTSYDYH